MSLPSTNKSLGQHWLVDIAALQSIYDAGDIGPDDTVLEVGPGPGALTQLLVAGARDVIAVEFDAALADALPDRVSAQNLRVVNQDILKFDLTTLPNNYKVVANIPYYLTSNLVRMLSESSNPACLAVLLIQKEVAERVAATPGQMSLLSVSAQFYWHAELGIDVPASMFVPPPKVDSQVLILKRRETPLFPDVDDKRFFRLVKAGFAARRKTLLNSLSGGLRLDKAAVTGLLSDADIDASLRPQALSLDQWYELYRQANAAEVI